MLAALARTLVGAAVLCTAGLGSVLAGGTSSATSLPARVTVGPVAVAPAARPLLDVSGPLLPLPPAPLTAPLRPLGPPAGPGYAEMGPPPVVGPQSSLSRVRAVQRLLNAVGAQLRVDGAWGPATTRAVEAVQRRAGLPVDGRVGPATAAALRG